MTLSRQAESEIKSEKKRRAGGVELLKARRRIEKNRKNINTGNQIKRRKITHAERMKQVSRDIEDRMLPNQVWQRQYAPASLHQQTRLRNPIIIMSI